MARPKTGGRRAGTPNKSTVDVRASMALLAERNVAKLEEWLTATAETNPAKAADLLLRALEYHIPKLARNELTGKDGRDLIPEPDLSDPAVLFDVARRLAFVMRSVEHLGIQTGQAASAIGR